MSVSIGLRSNVFFEKEVISANNTEALSSIPFTGNFAPQPSSKHLSTVNGLEVK